MTNIIKAPRVARCCSVALLQGPFEVEIRMMCAAREYIPPPSPSFHSISCNIGFRDTLLRIPIHDATWSLVCLADASHSGRLLRPSVCIQFVETIWGS